MNYEWIFKLQMNFEILNLIKCTNLMNLEFCNGTNNELMILNIQWNAQYDELLNNDDLLMLKWFMSKQDVVGKEPGLWYGKGNKMGRRKNALNSPFSGFFKFLWFRDCFVYLLSRDSQWVWVSMVSSHCWLLKVFQGIVGCCCSWNWLSIINIYLPSFAIWAFN